ncbi:MAG: recombinase family protein [Candidatus Acidiferrales bacterium]
MKLRCAIYARYSSDRQSPASIDDQIRKCREYAARQGWEVLEDRLYEDRAISGTLSDREGLKHLMAAAAEKAFDVVLIDDSSRLSRRVQDSLKLTDELKYHGIRLVCVSQNIDSDSEQGETLTVVHGLVDGLYVRELAAKTRRGLEGKALNRLHTGGRIFGYKSVPIEDSRRRDQYNRPMIAGARLQVDEEQAKIVRKIFSLYASGLSLKGVTKKLNAEKVRSPQPREGRQQTWAPSSVRVILHNPRYKGLVTWSKTKKVRNPQSGKKVRRARPESEWTRVEMPEQRIVSEQLWKAVQERLAYINKMYGLAGAKGGKMNLRAAASPYIFSGLLRCGVCGSNYMIVAGSGRNHRQATYGCPANALRGTCKNSRRIKLNVLEDTLLAKLQTDVLSDAAIDYCLDKLGVEIEKRFAALNTAMGDMQKRKGVLETEINNLSRALASGPEDVPSLRAAIVEREKEIRDLVAKVAGGKKSSVQKQIGDLRKFVRDGVRDIRGLLAGKHSQPARVRQELAKHIDAIMLLPDGKGDVRYKGQWKMLGNSRVSIGGAEGQS